MRRRVERVNACPCRARERPGPWESTLQGRDLDGNLSTFEAYYDTTLNITWLADANFGYGSSYDFADGYFGGSMTWANANAWAASLNPYGSGITGWRLPSTSPVNGSSFNSSYAYDGSTDSGYNISAPGTLYAGSTASEMAHMSYVTLGNPGRYDTAGISTGCFVAPDYCLLNTGPFSGVIAGYWSATEGGPYASTDDTAWGFFFSTGGQGGQIKTSSALYAWAVHTGDVGAAVVPVPAAVWLFSSGLIGLIGFARRRARAV